MPQEEYKIKSIGYNNFKIKLSIISLFYYFDIPQKSSFKKKLYISKKKIKIDFNLFVLKFC